MGNSRIKNLILFLKILTVIFALSSAFALSLSCNEVSGADSYAINEESKDDAEEADETDSNMEGEKVILPRPETESDISLEEALSQRRSVRSFSSEELSLDQISQILWAAQGITKESTGARTSPSAGALYPLEIFLLKSDGVFHYIPDGHKIIRLNSDDLRQKMVQGTLYQSFIAEAPINLIITAVYERTTSKYGDRGIRYVHLEAGHTCQSILLEAVALGLGAVPVGAFDDIYVQDLLDLPQDLITLYIVPIGYPKN